MRSLRKQRRTRTAPRISAWPSTRTIRRISNPYTSKGAPYKARVSADDRLTRPIAELPQTLSVLTETQIKESGYTDLARILDAQPGITVGTGENGNAFGDRYIIRGQEARSDVFVDGLRDPGMTTRESFAVDQIEIAKGPNSTFAGRGTAGGAVNLITKQASTDYSFTKASVGVGTDGFVRATADVNMPVSDTLAVRANALYAYTEIPNREPADRKRKGLAVSATFKPVDTFSLTLDYYGLRAKDNPDLGDYLLGDATVGERKPVKTPVYAQKQDFQKSDVDVFHRPSELAAFRQYPADQPDALWHVGQRLRRHGCAGCDHFGE
ncbi:TonB-dependent receptor [Novosphingobium colocasiae]